MQREIPFIAPWRLSGMPKETPVLLAFSGGADSSVLLHLLWKDAQREGYSLLLAHVNHGIRGEEALRDREFCRGMAERYGLEICFADLDIPALAKASGRSLEEEAREARYAFFKTLMTQRKIPLLATAHHADDNLETLLFRLARGTTSRGLCGILPTRDFYGVGSLVRPLLQATRDEILAYAAQNQLEYVTDSTNNALSCSRNQLRHRVIPVLEELFEHPQHRATALCEQMRLDDDYWSGYIRHLLERWEDTGCLILVLNGHHPAESSRILAEYVKKYTGFTPEYRHLQALLSMVKVGRNGAQCSLAGDWVATIEQGSLRLIPAARMTGCAFSIPFSKEEIRLPDSGIVIRVEKIGENTKIHNLSTALHMILDADSAIINDGLLWRSRKEGDTLVMGGMTRKLRKLYNQKKIPWRLREQMPLLCDGEGIVWAPFVGVRDGVQTAETGLLITVELPEALAPMC